MVYRMMGIEKNYNSPQSTWKFVFQVVIFDIIFSYLILSAIIRYFQFSAQVLQKVL